MRPLLFLFAGVVALAFSSVAGAAESDQFGEIQPLLEKHCYKCHNDQKKKGDVDLTRFKSEESILREYKLWRRVVEQVTAQEMPPDDATGFTQQHSTIVLNSLKRTLSELESDHSRFQDPGPSVIRRLSRLEYSNALRDLTGLELDLNGTVGFAPETTGSPFENTAAALSVPPALLEKYFAATDLVLTKLFGDAELSPAAREEAEKRLDGKTKAARVKFFAGLALEPERPAAEEFLARFAHRAWRRPLQSDERAALAGLYDAALSRGENARDALRQALKPVLVAPDFLFRLEEDRSLDGTRTAAKVSDTELASRLSFFLWSSLPDDELLALAEANRLAEPAVLEAQVLRLLADPKAQALTEGMLLRWLGAEKVLEARPTTEFFPGFNGALKTAMRDEVRTFCRHLCTDDRPVLDLLESDYTYVNTALAKHYSLAASITGPETQRVALSPEDHRGGILGMGAILAATSHTFRTSPSQRGKWVLEVVFGTPPPPPPANAGLFKDDKHEKEPKDFREKLAQHAGDPNCAGCHRKMDPLGFGLDNYNAVGQWRATSPDLATNGELPTGERFSGAAELKQILWARRSEFVRNLIAQTLTFALGREVDYFDEGQISRIARDMEQHEFRFSSLILGVVRSYPFQYRRPAAPAGEPTTAAR